MKDETREWLGFAEENRRAARVTLESRLYNACLQNCQQATEKSLKALLVEAGAPVRKTHSIRELRGILLARRLDVGLSDEDGDLLDSIYLPSKYPLGPALPFFEADASICEECLALADRVAGAVARLLDQS